MSSTTLADSATTVLYGPSSEDLGGGVGSSNKETGGTTHTNRSRIELGMAELITSLAAAGRHLEAVPVKTHKGRSPTTVDPQDHLKWLQRVSEHTRDIELPGTSLTVDDMLLGRGTFVHWQSFVFNDSNSMNYKIGTE